MTFCQSLASRLPHRIQDHAKLPNKIQTQGILDTSPVMFLLSIVATNLRMLAENDKNESDMTLSNKKRSSRTSSAREDSIRSTDSLQSQKTPCCSILSFGIISVRSFELQAWCHQCLQSRFPLAMFFWRSLSAAQTFLHTLESF